MTGRICVILNPASGRGRGRREFPRIRRAFGEIGVTDFRETAARGDEAKLVRAALDDGCSTIVAAGGDGTWSNTGRAILIAGAGREVGLALIAAGTGNDFAKSVGAPAADYDATAHLVAENKTKLVDAGRIGSDFFLNSIGFGFDASVLAEIEKTSWLRGSAVYMVAALGQLFTYRGVAVTTADIQIPSRPMMVIVANGGFLGGAFQIAPGASTTDGKLDTVVIGEMSPLARLRLFAAAMKGAHLGRPGVTNASVASITLHFESPPNCQRDGELDRLLTADVTLGCEAAALKVHAP